MNEKTAVTPRKVISSHAIDMLRQLKDALQKSKDYIAEFEKRINASEEKKVKATGYPDLHDEVVWWHQMLDELVERSQNLVKFLDYTKIDGGTLVDAPTQELLQKFFRTAMSTHDDTHELVSKLITTLKSKNKLEAKAQDIANQMKQKGFKYVVVDGDDNVEFAKDANDAAEKVKTSKDKVTVQTLETYNKRKADNVSSTKKQISEIRKTVSKRVLNDLAVKTISEARIDDIAAYIARSDANKARVTVLKETAVTKNEKKIWEDAFQRVR